ncbi:hypothetical protein GK107_10055 [Geobacillus thermoleovorans]|nr:hypothetical protein GK107_10055 [Geobacillus thermoleovorans]
MKTIEKSGIIHETSQKRLTITNDHGWIPQTLRKQERKIKNAERDVHRVEGQTLGCRVIPDTRRTCQKRSKHI